MLLLILQWGTSVMLLLLQLLLMMMLLLLLLMLLPRMDLVNEARVSRVPLKIRPETIIVDIGLVRTSIRILDIGGRIRHLEIRVPGLAPGSVEPAQEGGVVVAVAPVVSRVGPDGK